MEESQRQEVDKVLDAALGKLETEQYDYAVAHKTFESIRQLLPKEEEVTEILAVKGPHQLLGDTYLEVYKATPFEIIEPILTTAIRNKLDKMRYWNAIEILTKSDYGEETVKFLKYVIYHGNDEDAVELAAAKLVKLERIDLIKEALQFSDPKIRRSAIRGIASGMNYERASKDNPYIQLVTDHLADENRDVRSQCRWILAEREKVTDNVTVHNRRGETKDAANMPSVFISYSHKDARYAQKLKDDLFQRGFTPWIDVNLKSGERWFKRITDEIKKCDAVIVIMSNTAEQSEWVEREILLAQKYFKPIFPLLLDGEGFDMLIEKQYDDVRDGQLPPSSFYTGLQRYSTPR